MTELFDASAILLILLGSSAVGILVRPLLSERHWNRETFELVQLVSTMLVTFAAIVLGLLITSVKTSFDTVDSDLRGFGVQMIQINRCLQEYGPETAASRHQLRIYTAAAIASTWPNEAAPPGDYYPGHVTSSETGLRMASAQLGDILASAELGIRRLEPQDAMHQRLVSDCLDQFEQLVQRRWKLIEGAEITISTPFYIVLMFWLVVVFASFGLGAPRNMLAFCMLGLGAVSIASAVFVILDLDSPFAGFFQVSSLPLRAALAQFGQ
jgi:hypothetical protein